jgi:hypothetical protein
LARNDAIIVSFNYRLGALGWMAMDHISSNLKGTANLGLLDQIGKLYLSVILTLLIHIQIKLHLDGYKKISRNLVEIPIMLLLLDLLQDVMYSNVYIFKIFNISMHIYI